MRMGASQGDRQEWRICGKYFHGLQADHGLHGCKEIALKEAFGEDAVAAELWNQVFSAIRVPDQYKNGEEHYAYENPLNISRYLVNSFVGRNYKYLEE